MEQWTQFLPVRLTDSAVVVFVDSVVQGTSGKLGLICKLPPGLLTA